MRHVVFVLALLTAGPAACSSGGGSNTSGGGTSGSSTGTGTASEGSAPRGSCVQNTKNGGTLAICTDYVFAASAPSTVEQGVKATCGADLSGDNPYVGTWEDGKACAQATAKGGCAFIGDTSNGTVWYYQETAAAIQEQCSATYSNGKKDTFVAPSLMLE